MKILESYKDMMMELVNEVDDDKIIKYKKKDGDQGEMKAGSAKSMPTDHPAKLAWDKMQGDGDGEEKPKGQAMGGDDFDRDANRAADDEADDMDRDARFAADAEDDNAESDDVEISDSNSGPIDLDDISDMLKKDPEVMDKIGTGDDDDLYWDGLDLVSSKMDDQTVASIDDDSNMTLGDLKKQIMDFEPEDEDEEETDESVTINGKKYKPIKESKQHILKENYDRFFGER